MKSLSSHSLFLSEPLNLEHIQLLGRLPSQRHTAIEGIARWYENQPAQQKEFIWGRPPDAASSSQVMSQICTVLSGNFQHMQDVLDGDPVVKRMI